MKNMVRFEFVFLQWVCALIGILVFVPRIVIPGRHKEYAKRMLKHALQMRRWWPQQYTLFCQALQKNTAFGQKSVMRNKIWILDYLLSAVLYGASWSDYLYCLFYRHGWFYRRKCVTIEKLLYFEDIVNDRNVKHLCNVKSDFAEYWSEFFGRKWAKISSKSAESNNNCLKMLSQCDSVIVKPMNLYGGKDICVVRGDELLD